MAFDINARTTFDEVAKLYDVARPGYPEALFDDLVALTGIPENGRILEIGCGPGKATVPLAKRGYEMVCVELGKELAAIAAENCRDYPAVTIKNMPFEEWPVEEESFDVAMCAQAFHWIPKAVGFKHTAAALRGNGRLVLFWNYPPPMATPAWDAIQRVYQEHTPHMASKHTANSISTRRERTLTSIANSGYYDHVITYEYPWTTTYTTSEYINLINTYSDHRSLDPETRQTLCEGIAKCIDLFGGELEKHYLTLLYIANKSSNL
ncbi:MAG: class I SAM-dependent methyltransferase [Chloroflexi bacterium]|nr:MAG: class I SAM-dependent methyltransferase [Chloroflexota bacterium]